MNAGAKSLFWGWVRGNLLRDSPFAVYTAVNFLPALAFNFQPSTLNGIFPAKLAHSSAALSWHPRHLRNPESKIQGHFAISKTSTVARSPSWSFRPTTSAVSALPPRKFKTRSRPFSPRVAASGNSLTGARLPSERGPSFTPSTSALTATRGEADLTWSACCPVT